MEIKNIFDKNGLKDDQIETQVDLVWADTTHRIATGGSPLYFKMFSVKPVDRTAINQEKNQRQLKHVMLGTLLWNSLAPKFQLEMLTKESSFKKG
eukprot:5063092-Ditylum_brightwellii.AAC.1